jgi:O-antigen/teichoic acid export membrane protein
MVGALSISGRALLHRLRTGKVLRGTAAYAFAASAQRLIGFLLLPFYTRALQPAEYGQLAIIIAFGAAVQTLLSFGLETAVFRELVRLKGSPVERREFINSIGLFSTIVPASLSIILGVVAWLWISDPFSVPGQGLLIAFLAAGFQASAVVLPLALLRAEERLGAYVRVNLLYTATSAALAFVAVVVLDLGVMGFIVSNLVAAMVLLVGGLRAIEHRWTSTVSGRVVWDALAFGLPMLPHALLHWALGLSDRVILGTFVEPAALGVYSLAYQFATPVSMLVVALNQAIMPRYARASVTRDELASLRGVVTQQALVVGLLGLGAALLVPPIIRLILPEAYWGAADLVPMIVLGVALFGLYLIPMDTIVLVAGRTRWIWVATLVAALANVGLNLVLVPRFGVFAAAWNTGAGYAVLLLAIYVYLRRAAEEQVRYDWPAITLGGLILLGTYATSTMVIPDPGNLPTLLIRMAIVAGVAVLLMAGASHRTRMIRPGIRQS